MINQGVAFSGFVLSMWVMEINSFASRTVQVESNQRVISNGPYGIVRHPMYLGVCMTLLSAPFALGSYYAFGAFVLVIPCLVLRILNEEKILIAGLPGYSEYCARTRFRLVPFFW